MYNKYSMNVIKMCGNNLHKTVKLITIYAIDTVLYITMIINVKFLNKRRYCYIFFSSIIIYIIYIIIFSIFGLLFYGVN